MSLEHSPARQNKNAPRSAIGADEDEHKRGPPSSSSVKPPIFPYKLLRRDEVAERLRTTAITVTRNYRKWGLRPIRIAGHILFKSDEILALEAKLQESGEEA